MTDQSALLAHSPCCNCGLGCSLIPTHCGRCGQPWPCPAVASIAKQPKSVASKALDAAKAHLREARQEDQVKKAMRDDGCATQPKAEAPRQAKARLIEDGDGA